MSNVIRDPSLKERGRGPPRSGGRVRLQSVWTRPGGQLMLARSINTGRLGDGLYSTPSFLDVFYGLFSMFRVNPALGIGVGARIHGALQARFQEVQRKVTCIAQLVGLEVRRAGQLACQFSGFVLQNGRGSGSRFHGYFDQGKVPQHRKSYGVDLATSGPLPFKPGLPCCDQHAGNDRSGAEDCLDVGRSLLRGDALLLHDVSQQPHQCGHGESG
ncbi:hypothetical protein SAMN02799626_00517 [Caulobacter sp. UNC279MFTsu5.1]|nr:hypothetical protein SAMN02799626_00517 [Caulobacter sp. UNC279MFTsu5.1]